jgi:EpsI family protein
VLFWAGRRWHDEPVVASTPADTIVVQRPWASWWPVPVAVVLALAGPVMVEDTIERIGAHVADKSNLIVLPAATNSWRGPADDPEAWRPLYRGGAVERLAHYDDATGNRVDVFVAVYGLGASDGTEMISYRNVVIADEHSNLPPEARHNVKLGGVDDPLIVREVTVQDEGRPRLVWYWFVIGDHPVADAFVAKALEAALFVTRGAQSERIVALSTPGGDDARDRLEALVRAHGTCVAHGFQRESCAP